MYELLQSAGPDATGRIEAARLERARLLGALFAGFGRRMMAAVTRREGQAVSPPRHKRPRPAGAHGLPPHLARDVGLTPAANSNRPVPAAVGVPGPRQAA